MALGWIRRPAASTKKKAAKATAKKSSAGKHAKATATKAIAPKSMKTMKRPSSKLSKEPRARETDGIRYVMENGKRCVPQADSKADWKDFTPSEIQKDLCVARIWGGGRGGQCCNSPEPGDEMCDKHATNGATHGRVDGPIPAAKLREFEYWSAVLAKRAASASAAQ